MKMKYEKPLIAVEHYELSQTIATCMIQIGMNDSLCVLKDEDATSQMKAFAANQWFVQGSCLEYPLGGQQYDGWCYHTNANAMFNS